MDIEKQERLDALSALSLQRALEPQELKDFRRLNRELAKEQETELSRRSRNNRRKGKRNERALAEKLGGKADGLPGHRDISAGPFSIEVKAGGHLPKRVVNGLLECDRLGGGKTSVLCIRSSADRGTYHHAGVVCMWEEDFLQWFGALKEIEKVD